MNVDSALVARHHGYGPFLNVITWVLLVTSGLAVLTRLVTKRALKRGIGVDDAFVVAALVTSIGSGVSVCIQTANGLGRNFGSLDPYQIEAYEKSEYANKLLYIATLAFAKLSIISLLMILTASPLHHWIGRSLAASIAVWGVLSIFASAFQCGAHEPWRRLNSSGENLSHCINESEFWRATCIINMLTDLALILFPVQIIVPLQTSAGKKAMILAFFGTRIFDIIGTCIQLAYIHAFETPNPTQAMWKWTLTTQIIACITIITSCVPYLRPVFEAIPSGMYAADEPRRHTTPSIGDYLRSGNDESFDMSDFSSSTGGNKSRKSQRESGIKRFIPSLSLDPTTHSNSASGLPGGPRRPDGEIGVEITAPGPPNSATWDNESISSQAKIVKTTVVSAEWEQAERRSRESPTDGIWSIIQ
ncbi:hypothetical protein BCR34DRAFT_271458 [Clohesyomyces aquaticus]|uniref:Rhodopsin domain-containing protein n=1 Tax=Clohesyomyces aquaticus TaxID=1231657 RepID=A0A1Y1Y1U8_9PLEO|nr:hypothetical protein BCR34DRAFT_271458 [Clohesyomyces aquaticus]